MREYCGICERHYDGPLDYCPSTGALHVCGVEGSSLRKAASRLSIELIVFAALLLLGDAVSQWTLKHTQIPEHGFQSVSSLREVVK